MNDEMEIIEITDSDIIYKSTDDYTQLKNKPQINGKELVGNLVSEDLGLQEEGDYPEENISDQEIEDIFDSNEEENTDE